MIGESHLPLTTSHFWWSVIGRGSSDRELRGEIVGRHALGLSKVYASDKVAITVLEDWCKGCEICVEVCTKNCLVMNALGIVEVVDLEACNKCLLCDLLCPDFAICVE